MATPIESMITPATLALVEQHRAAGDELVIITASNSFVARPIAERFGAPTLLAVELERAGDRYTGRISGTPTFQEGKVVRLRERLLSSGSTLEGSSFYSDSHNDLPLLELVDNPVAVDPDPVLLAHAEAAGWPMLYLRGTTS
jgi:HAD superfamily hydrolase (TIGR01490 family)